VTCGFKTGVRNGIDCIDEIIEDVNDGANDIYNATELKRQTKKISRKKLKRKK
jgi:hypothetical protein